MLEIEESLADGLDSLVESSVLDSAVLVEGEGILTVSMVENSVCIVSNPCLRYSRFGSAGTAAVAALAVAGVVLEG